MDRPDTLDWQMDIECCFPTWPCVSVSLAIAVVNCLLLPGGWQPATDLTTDPSESGNRSRPPGMAAFLLGNWWTIIRRIVPDDRVNNLISNLLVIPIAGPFDFALHIVTTGDARSRLAMYCVLARMQMVPPTCPSLRLHCVLNSND